MAGEQIMPSKTKKKVVPKAKTKIAKKVIKKTVTAKKSKVVKAVAKKAKPVKTTVKTKIKPKAKTSLSKAKTSSKAKTAAKTTKKIAPVKKLTTQKKAKPAPKKVVKKISKVAKVSVKKAPKPKVSKPKTTKTKIVRPSKTTKVPITKVGTKVIPPKKVKTKMSTTKATKAKAVKKTAAPNIHRYSINLKEEYMNETQRKHIENILLGLRQNLQEEVDRTITHMQEEPGNVPDVSDRASLEENFGVELRTRDRERLLLKKIEDALERVRRDDFGYCETCGIEIGLRRLEARPTANLCIDCKEIAEVKEKQESGL